MHLLKLILQRGCFLKLLSPSLVHIRHDYVIPVECLLENGPGSKILRIDVAKLSSKIGCFSNAVWCSACTTFVPPVSALESGGEETGGCCLLRGLAACFQLATSCQTRYKAKVFDPRPSSEERLDESALPRA